MCSFLIHWQVRQAVGVLCRAHRHSLLPHAAVQPFSQQLASLFDHVCVGSITAKLLAAAVLVCVTKRGSCVLAHWATRFVQDGACCVGQDVVPCCLMACCALDHLCCTAGGGVRLWCGVCCAASRLVGELQYWPMCKWAAGMGGMPAQCQSHSNAGCCCYWWSGCHCCCAWGKHADLTSAGLPGWSRPAETQQCLAVRSTRRRAHCCPFLSPPMMLLAAV